LITRRYSSSIIRAKVDRTPFPTSRSKGILSDILNALSPAVAKPERISDGITLCCEPPVTINKGEIAVASREELHAALLSAKRLLALWNALPGVEKQTKVGDRNTLIDRLWTAIEALPDPEQQSDAKRIKTTALVRRDQLVNGWFTEASIPLISKWRRLSWTELA
jgi:hypothetical protein